MENEDKTVKEPGLKLRHRGPVGGFGVQRYPAPISEDPKQRQRAYDVVFGREIQHGETLTIHWPEQEESRVICVEESTDRHGTMHRRAYFEISHYGAPIRVYLRDVQGFISVLR